MENQLINDFLSALQNIVSVTYIVELRNVSSYPLQK